LILIKKYPNKKVKDIVICGGEISLRLKKAKKHSKADIYAFGA
jgi:hypothetical protein